MKRAIDALKERVLIGLITFLPLVIVLYILRAIYNIFFNMSYPIMHLLYIKSNGVHIILTIFIILILCIIILSVGLAVRTSMGTESFNFVEELFLKKLPGYTMLKETIDKFKYTEDSRSPFSRIALVDVYETDVLLGGFVTDEAEKHYTIYIPVAPNITSGFIHHVEKRSVYLLSNCEPSDMIKSLVNCGIGSSKILQEGKIDEKIV